MKEELQLQEKLKVCKSRNLEKRSHPLHLVAKTLSFREIQKYDSFNMSATLITSNIERAVQRELAGRKDFPFKMFFGFIGVGIMIFLIFLGAMVLMNSGGMTLPTIGVPSLQG